MTTTTATAGGENDAHLSVETLRRDFDRSFAEAIRDERPDLERFVAIRIGAADGYAIKLSAIANIVAGRKIVPLPTPAPHLQGIAGIRGVIVPIYDLASVLGYHSTRTSNDGSSKWIVCLNADYPIGFSSLIFEGYLEVPRNQVSTTIRAGADKPPRAVVDTAAILAKLKAAAAAAAAHQER